MGTKLSIELSQCYSYRQEIIFKDISNRGLKPQQKNNPIKHNKQESEIHSPSQILSTILSSLESSLQLPFLTKVGNKINEYPGSAVGKLDIDYGTTHAYGTAFLIHRKFALTCAHHCYNRKERKEAKSILFIVGQGDAKRKILVKKYYYPKQYSAILSKTRQLWNFAVLELEDDLSLQFGYFGINFDDCDIGANLPKFIYGYMDGEQQLYRFQGQLKVINGEIKHNYPTKNGVSGAPIFYETYDGFMVIGIHCENGNSENKGIKTTIKIYEKFKEWLIDRFGELNCKGKWLGHDKVKNVVNIDWNNLRKVNLSLNNFESGAVQKIVGAVWPVLEELDLSENQISNEGIKELINGKWKNLKKLNLGHNYISCAGIQELSNNSWSELTQINLNQNLIESKGARWIIECNWPKLQTLRLSNNCIKKQGALQLSKSRWKQLETLDLEKNGLESEGIFWLIRANWKKLSYLDICKNKIGNEGIFNLIECSWRHMIKINLGQNEISDEGIKQLCKLQWFKLRQLILRDNKVSPEGVVHLAHSNWKYLQTIDLRWNHIVQADEIALRNILNQRIQSLKQINF